MKIFKEGEQPRGFTESYIVKFWWAPKILPGNHFWSQRTERYYACNSKSAHEAVEKKWRSDFKGQLIKLISVIYE